MNAVCRLKYKLWYCNCDNQAIITETTRLK